ncbi:interferon gamma receptor 1 [Scomber scombrus]|uniref:Interferon gamma receptor 1 n=1 Tax=Scomber scombrus TaxID=13677 RepID=A0AAV1Q5H0_SCOSC
MLLFTALLLLITAVSAEIVPPPTNVTVICQNLTTIVHWVYSEQEPPTRFRVNIKGTGAHWEHVNETTDHQYDLSHLIWESDDHYMDYISVTVTAIQGVNESESESISFSYNDKKTVNFNCQLDFPPVKLTVDGSLSFQNPLNYYKQLNQAVKWGDHTFSFQVLVKGAEYSGHCGPDQNTCEFDVPGAKNTCVKLKGGLFQNEIGRIPFRDKNNICASESDDPHVMTLVIMLVVLLLIIIGVTFLICKVKAWTMKTPPKPSTLEPLINRGPGNHIVSESDPSRVEVVAPNRKKSLSGSSEEINHYGRLEDDNSAGSDLQDAPRSAYQERRLSESSSEELEAGGLTSEGQRTDDDSPDDSVKTECVSLVSMEEEEEEEGRSPYDCPHTHVDMGDGDMVLGYKE